MIIAVLIFLANKIIKQINHNSSIINLNSQFLTFSILCFGISVFMTITISKPIWEILSPLWYLQFPWRFLGPLSFFAALLIAGITLIIKNKKIKIIFTALLTVAAIFFYKNIFVPQRYLDIDDSHYTSKEALQWEVSRMSYEYVPGQVKTTKTILDTTVLAITKNDLPQEKISITKGSGEILSQKIKSQEYDISLNIKEPADIRLSTYYFPGWKAYLDNRPVTIDSDNDFYLITIKNISPSSRHLLVRFENTPIRTAGNLISLISIALLVALFGKKYKLKLWPSKQMAK